MYQTMYMDERVPLAAAELNIVTSPETIQEILEQKLRETHEGKCNANGFIRPGSIKLLGRSMGVAENGRFTGNLLYDCKVSCEVLYPTAGSQMDAKVIKVNRMGAYAVFEEAIRILLPRDLHIGNVEFDELKEGDVVKVQLDRSRFQTKDAYIMAVGHLKNGQ
jgi:DNA-directed RNA polymerase subunit E'/Rpb7